jgi:hypothetical protein
MRSGRHALRGASVAMMVGLGACQGTGGSFSGSAAGIPVKVESIDGAPAQVKTAFASALLTAAYDRQVDLVGSGTQARYRVRGYLTTESTEDGSTALAYVWDVFDDSKRRTRRLTGSSPIRIASGKASWTGLDKAALAKLAAQSMDEIAGFLSESGSGATRVAQADPL